MQVSTVIRVINYADLANGRELATALRNPHRRHTEERPFSVYCLSDLAISDPNNGISSLIATNSTVANTQYSQVFCESLSDYRTHLESHFTEPLADLLFKHMPRLLTHSHFLPNTQQIRNVLRNAASAYYNTRPSSEAGAVAATGMGSSNITRWPAHPLYSAISNELFAVSPAQLAEFLEPDLIGFLTANAIENPFCANLTRAQRRAAAALERTRAREARRAQQIAEQAQRREQRMHAKTVAQVTKKSPKLRQVKPQLCQAPTPAQLFELWQHGREIPPRTAPRLRNNDYSTRTTHYEPHLPCIGAEFELDHRCTEPFSATQLAERYADLIGQTANILDIQLDSRFLYCSDGSLSGTNPGELKVAPIPRHAAPLVLDSIAAMMRSHGFTAPNCCGGHLTFDLKEIPRANRPLLALLLMSKRNNPTFVPIFGRAPGGYCQVEDTRNYDRALDRFEHPSRWAVHYRSENLVEFRQPSGNALLTNTPQLVEMLNSTIDWAKTAPPSCTGWTDSDALADYLSFIEATERYHAVLTDDYKLAPRLLGKLNGGSR